MCAPWQLVSQVTIVAGTFSDAFRSSDNGDSWVAVNNGLEFPFVTSLAIDSDEDSFPGHSKAAAFIARLMTSLTVTPLANQCTGQIFAATFVDVRPRLASVQLSPLSVEQ